MTATGEPDLFRRMRDVVRDVLGCAAVTAKPRAGPRDAGSRATSVLPVEDDLDHEALRRSMGGALCGTPLAVPVREVRPPQLAAP